MKRADKVFLAVGFTALLYIIYSLISALIFVANERRDSGDASIQKVEIVQRKESLSVQFARWLASSVLKWNQVKLDGPERVKELQTRLFTLQRELQQRSIDMAVGNEEQRAAAKIAMDSLMVEVHAASAEIREMANFE